MLIIIVGPSGSGKTTLIKEVLKYCSDISAISVDVFSPHTRIYEIGLGRNNVSEVEFNQNLVGNRYHIINEYDSCKYGYTIPKDYSSKSKLYLLDYPGEYPECEDLKGFEWLGVLIITKERETLIKRLNATNRKNRMPSALAEFDECYQDIKESKMNNNWDIIYNEESQDLIFGIETIIQKLQPTFCISNGRRCGKYQGF